MASLYRYCWVLLCSMVVSLAFADGCCRDMGGISYCDSSAGRLVCRNGFYSACYCTRHAVMDMTLFRGCCLWHAGVMAISKETGFVVCRDGWVSEECTLLNSRERLGAW